MVWRKDTSPIERWRRRRAREAGQAFRTIGAPAVLAVDLRTEAHIGFWLLALARLQRHPGAATGSGANNPGERSLPAIFGLSVVQTCEIGRDPGELIEGGLQVLDDLARQHRRVAMPCARFKSPISPLSSPAIAAAGG